jgi:MFS family permease
MNKQIPNAKPDPANENGMNKKAIRTFALASFFNDFGSDIIYPIWPLFLTTVLKANMAAVGLLDGLGDALVSISQAVSGYLSDRFKKRKIFIWVGYLCGSLSRLGYAISAVWPQAIPFRVLDRAGKMRGAPRDAIVADISVDSNRGKHFGLLRAMDNYGAMAGILVCIAFVNLLGYRLLFALAAIPSLISVILILTAIKEPATLRTKVFKGLVLKDIDRNFRLYFVLNAIFALGAFSYSFLIVFAQRSWVKVSFLGISMTGIKTVPLLYLLFTAVAAVMSLPFGKLSDRIGRKKVMFLALGFWAAVSAGILISRTDWLIVLVFVFFGLHKAALEPVQRALVSEMSPVAFRASSLGAFQMVIGLAALPASLMAGLLWDKVGLRAPFVVSLGLTFVSGVLLLFVKEKRSLQVRDGAGPLASAGK